MVPVNPLVIFFVLALANLPGALALCVHDVREQRLPNLLVLATTGATLAAGAILALVFPELKPRFVSAAALFLGVAVVGIIFALVFPQAIGMGDAKSAPCVFFLAALWGPGTTVAAAAWICLVGSIVALIVLIRTRSAHSRFAFGPILLSAPYGGLAIATIMPAMVGN